MSAELFDRRKGDQLRSELLGDPEAFGAKANALVAEFWQGYPLDELRSLLHSTTMKLREQRSTLLRN
jgi:hypothetical protein